MCNCQTDSEHDEHIAREVEEHEWSLLDLEARELGWPPFDYPE